MLQNNFYHIKAFEKKAFLITAEIEINPLHKIFEGHFPHQPVVPGVCMIEIIKEITEQAIEKKIFLQQANEIKFLSMINPEENNIIQAGIKYAIEENTVTTIASLSKEDLIYFKLKGNFVFC